MHTLQGSSTLNLSKIYVIDPKIRYIDYRIANALTLVRTDHFFSLQASVVLSPRLKTFIGPHKYAAFLKCSRNLNYHIIIK